MVAASINRNPTSVITSYIETSGAITETVLETSDIVAIGSAEASSAVAITNLTVLNSGLSGHRHSEY
jgi:hypothetical protein